MVSFRNSDSLKISPTVFKRFRLPNLSNNSLIQLFNSVWTSTISLISTYNFSYTQSISTERFSNSYSGKTSIAMLTKFQLCIKSQLFTRIQQYSLQLSKSHNTFQQSSFQQYQTHKHNYMSVI